MMPAEPETSAFSEEPLKAKILIVDDDERTTLAVSTVLEDLNQDLVIAHSGEEALRKLLFDDFAVILLDLHMPGMDGYETAGLIRSRKRTRHVPILFLTAVFRDESHLFQAYSAGAVDMVFKPADPFILKAKVSVFVDLYLRQAEAQREAELRHRLQQENVLVRTEKTRTEQILKQTEEAHRLVIEGVRDCAIFMLDATGHVMSWNLGASRIKGYTSDEIIGQHFSKFFTDEDRASGLAERALEVAARDGKFEIEGWRVRKDGSMFWASVLVDAIRNDDGELLGFAKITRDVTERRETLAQLELTREQLFQAQKMEAVGQLTGGIAHDFNNLLTVVLGNIDLLSGKLKDETSKRRLGAMKHATERGRRLTSQLLAFSRRQHLTPETLDVKALIQGFDPLLRRAVGESMMVAIELPDQPLVSDLDPSQLETTLLNLAVNARDAMPEGGRLTLRLERVEREPSLVARFPEAPLGPWHVISIRDTGTGMPKDVQDRAFEPFFTTKEPGKGSGLGLSQVYGFVRQSGGFVTLDSTLGKGTNLSIYLPPSDKPLPRATQPRETQPASKAKSESVLLVEDDAAVLALATDILLNLGYRVVTASDANAALEILKRGEPVDLLLSDVVMPGGKTGVQLATEARALRPDMKVLLTSGYPGEALARHKSSDFDFPLIAKPFQQAELADRLRQILDAEKSRKA